MDSLIILAIKNALNKIKSYYIDQSFEPEIRVTLPNNKIDCHYCSNLLFSLKRNLKEGYEQEFKKALQDNDIISDVEFVNGYINLKMQPIFFKRIIENILNGNIFPNTGNGMKTNVEYCSINPTGFLHIGHARNAILGDSIARILSKANFDITKEYYINDGGNQLNLLAESVLARFCELNDLEHTFPENGYIGKEIYEIAKLINKDTSTEEIKQIAIEYFMNAIKQDLADLKINYDIFTKESDIIKSGYIEKAIKHLNAKNFLYEGERTEKKVQKGKVENKPLLLLKTTLFNDEEDRPLTKADGSWTYQIHSFSMAI